MTTTVAINVRSMVLILSMGIDGRNEGRGLLQAAFPARFLFGQEANNYATKRNGYDWQKNDDDKFEHGRLRWVLTVSV